MPTLNTSLKSSEILFLLKHSCFKLSYAFKLLFVQFKKCYYCLNKKKKFPETRKLCLGEEGGHFEHLL